MTAYNELIEVMGFWPLTFLVLLPVVIIGILQKFGSRRQETDLPGDPDGRE